MKNMKQRSASFNANMRQKSADAKANMKQRSKSLHSKMNTPEGALARNLLERGVSQKLGVNPALTSAVISGAASGSPVGMANSLLKGIAQGPSSQSTQGTSSQAEQGTPSQAEQGMAPMMAPGMGYGMAPGIAALGIGEGVGYGPSKLGYGSSPGIKCKPLPPEPIQKELSELPQGMIPNMTRKTPGMEKYIEPEMRHILKPKKKLTQQEIEDEQLMIDDFLQRQQAEPLIPYTESMIQLAEVDIGENSQKASNFVVEYFVPPVSTLDRALELNDSIGYSKDKLGGLKGSAGKNNDQKILETATALLGHLDRSKNQPQRQSGGLRDTNHENKSRNSTFVHILDTCINRAKRIGLSKNFTESDFAKIIEFKETLERINSDNIDKLKFIYTDPKKHKIRKKPMKKLKSILKTAKRSKKHRHNKSKKVRFAK